MNTCPICAKPILPYAILEEEEIIDEFCTCAKELGPTKILAEMFRIVEAGEEDGGAFQLI